MEDFSDRHRMLKMTQNAENADFIQLWLSGLPAYLRRSLLLR